LVVLLMLLVPSIAVAAPDADRTAARHFADGQKAFTAGDYAHAGGEFEAAYRDKPHHAPLWNAARSWQRAGEDVRAANLYARYLREAPPDAPDRDQATAALRTLTARMGRIEPHAAGVEKLRLDGKAVEAPVVYVAAGEHIAEADDKGRLVRKVVRVTAGELVSVTLAPEPKSAPVVVVGPPPPPPIAPAPARKPLSPVVPLIGGVLTAVAGGLAIASGLDTRSKRDDFLDDRTQPRLDDAFASQTRTNVMIGTTAGLGVITGVIAIFFTDWSGGSTSEGSTMAGAR
jgi:hypothetical protein